MKEFKMKSVVVLLSLICSFSAFGEEFTIIQKDKNFDKKEITLKVGDTINFKNDEKDITHNVFSLGPKNPFELKTQPPGKTSSVTFKEKGTTEVECAIHQGMKLKVTVNDKK
jgi:plastocyanin